MKHDNPAARLLAILEAGRNHAPDASCRKVWEALLEAKGDSALLMARLGKVMGLSQQAVDGLKELFPDHHSSWAHWESTVNAAFMVQNMHGQWESFNKNIDEHTINYLRLSSELLQARTNTKLAVDDELKEVRSRLDAVLQEVLASDQPDEVKAYLVRNLRKIITALDEYRLTGAPAVLDAVEIAAGHSALDPRYRNFLFDSELGKRVLDTLAATANVVAVGVGLPQLQQAITLLAA